MLDQLPLRTDLPLERTFTQNEVDLIKQGFRADSMDIKWSMLFEDGWLAFFRTWWPVPIFLLHLSEEADGARIDQAYANRDTDSYSGTGTEEEMRLITFLIDRLLLGRVDAVLRKADGEPITGLYLFYKVGNV